MSARSLSQFRQLHRDVYIARSARVGALTRARAAWLYAEGDGVLGELSAAALHGTRYINDDEPAVLIRSRTSSRRTSRALVIRNYDLPEQEIERVRGLPATTAPRTAFDLGRRLPRDAAVLRIDALARAADITADDIRTIAEEHPRMHGVRRLLRALELVDPLAESPQESRTRLLIIDHGLPRPVSQIRIADEYGRIFARADLGWPQWKVLVEYDGSWHWEDKRQRSWDIERQEQLTALGWRVVRVTAEQLRNVPGLVLGRITAQLREAGAPV